MKNHPGVCGLSICEAHEREIVEAIEAAGLKDFYKKDGDGGRRLIDRMTVGPTVDNFDPFYDLQMSAVLTMQQTYGARLAVGLEPGATACIVCIGVKLHPSECTAADCCVGSSKVLFQKAAERQVEFLSALMAHEVKH